MIYQGNYDDFLYTRLKPYLKQAFIEYYGKQYREEIEDNFNNTNVIPFYDKNYIEEYYISFINKFRDKILDKFYAKIGIERCKELDDVIWKENTKYENLDILSVKNGGKILSSDVFTEKTIKKNYASRKKIYNAFKEELNLSDDIYKEVCDLYNVFKESRQEVEKENTCDVFEDINTLRDNKLENTKAFLNKMKNVMIFSQKDLDILNKPDFCLLDMYEMDCGLMFFGYDLEYPGLASVFSRENTKKIFDEKTDNDERLDLIISRLQFLPYLDDKIKYKNFTRDEIFDLNKNLYSLDKNSKEFIDFVNKIYDEFNFQCDHPFVNSNIKLDKEKKRKYWDKGEFLPSSATKYIEKYREQYKDKIFDGCKFYENIYNYKDTYDDLINNNWGGSNEWNYSNNKFYKTNRIIGMLEDNYINPLFYIDSLIHELNHSMPNKMPKKLDKNNAVFKESVYLLNIEKDGSTLGNAKSVTCTTNVLEYCNQKQTDEILKIFKKIMNKENLFLPNDNVLKKNKIECAYDLYKFLLDDFYQLFHDEIKTNVIDLDYQFHFDTFNIDKNPVVDKIIGNIRKKFDKINVYKSGEIEIENIARLNKLVDIFNKDIVPEIYMLNMSVDEFNNMDNWNKFSKINQLKLQALIIEKNKIMNKILKDKNTKILVENKINNVKFSKIKEEEMEQ